MSGNEESSTAIYKVCVWGEWLEEICLYNKQVFVGYFPAVSHQNLKLQIVRKVFEIQKSHNNVAHCRDSG